METRKRMKRLILSTIIGLALANVAFAQAPQFPGQQPPEKLDLPKFDLDFEGGTPQELVDAIRAKIDEGKLNAIIPSEFATQMLPPMKMKGVDVHQLFKALEMASTKNRPYVTGEISGRKTVQQRSLSMGFRTADRPVTRDSVWSFHVETLEQPPEAKFVRYYSLKRYLSDYDVDDITTAILAGWKMLDEGAIPKMNFHEDTKMLIAVGLTSQLALIDSVLAELDKGLKDRPNQSPPAAPVIDASRSKTNAPAF